MLKFLPKKAIFFNFRLKYCMNIQPLSYTPIVRKSAPSFGVSLKTAAITTGLTALTGAGVGYYFYNGSDYQKYRAISTKLSAETKQIFDQMYNSKFVQNRSSNDGSSVLENLYKITTKKRTPGFNVKDILEITVKTLANPYLVEQKFVSLPSHEVQKMFDDEKAILRQLNESKPNDAKDPQDMIVETSATCPVASIEFNMADKTPAEFVRFVEGLTGEKNEVKIKRKLNEIEEFSFYALQLLHDFKTPYKLIDKDTVEVTLKPDRGAIVRARVQNTYRKTFERSFIDALIQSTLMQVGSQGTYNSYTDKRYGSFNYEDSGLTEYEKTYVETLVEGSTKKTSVTYQITDDNLKLTGRTTDYQTMQNQLTTTLDEGKNVIIGTTWIDEQNQIIGGHEVTLTGYRKDESGNVIFSYQDSDDDNIGAVEISAGELLPSLHHASISNSTVTPEPREDLGVQALRAYLDYKKSK